MMNQSWNQWWPALPTHIYGTRGRWFNTLRPRQNGRHFPDAILKCIFLNENVWISIKISPKFVPKGPINNIPALVQIMAWRRPGDKPLSEPMLVIYRRIYASPGLNELTVMDFNLDFNLQSRPHYYPSIVHMLCHLSISSAHHGIKNQSSSLHSTFMYKTWNVRLESLGLCPQWTPHLSDRQWGTAG